jgi:hypothetical protein
MFQVWNIEGLSKKRFGGEHDGGYVILDSSLGAKHLLGYGVDKDVSFENQVTKEWGIKAHVFDHTITQVPPIGPDVTYISEGIGPKDEAPLFTLANHVKRFVPEGAEYILKMDVEGAEWDVLRTADLSRVTQLILELHELQDDNSEIIKKINEKFFLINIHGNNCHNQPCVYIDRAHKMPRYLECVWVRKDLVRSTGPSTVPLPHPLDNKCRSDVPDVPYDFISRSSPPVSFVVTDSINLQIIKHILTENDEVVPSVDSAKHARIFIIRPGDVFPYEHILAIPNYPGNMTFYVGYNGLYLQEQRFILRNCGLQFETKTPINNIKPLKGYR